MDRELARGGWKLVTVAAALLISAPEVFAQNASRTVRFEGRALFRVWSTSEAEAVARAGRIERRLALLIDQGDRRERAVVKARESDRTIHVGSVLVATVTPLDAEENLIVIDRLAAQWAREIDAALERGRARRVSWGRFVSAVDGSVRTAFARVGESAITVVPRLIAGTLVLFVFWLLAASSRALLGVLFRHVLNDRTVASFIKQLVYYTIWIIGIVIAIHALGFDPASAVAALGLTSLALGFALKDILSNLVSGILTLALRPFEIGDQIVVGETEGAVERIRLRATHIRTYDGRLVLVPNAELFTSRVINNTASPQRRTSVRIPMSYKTDIPRALSIAQEAAAASPGVSETPSPGARLRELGEGDAVMEVQFWTDSRRSDVVATAAEVRAAVVMAFQAEGIDLPDPALRVLQDDSGMNSADREK